MAESIKNLLIVFSAGFLPSLLWLWFWLKEDPHPEPRKTLLKSFLAGIAIVPFVFLLEYGFLKLLVTNGVVQKSQIDYLPLAQSLILFLGWAFIEEISKFFTAWWVDLRRSVYDEPVDAMIYLITVSLGFAALENALFLNKVLPEGVIQSAMTLNLRFLGATLLHSLTAGVMGASIALSFFHKEHVHRNVIGGIILATLLHWSFNAIIINSESELMFQTFFAVWSLVVVLIFIFERVKRLHA
ncbi:PrsW family intramembrane metalloprotease [Candidatus Giovannonibacteria bacterium]|nr:PrsW family intramembrane metalloprotease [Candidatus Giovannonibacteria bacterium]